MNLRTRRDARSLSHETLEEYRRLAVRRVKAGETQRSVAGSLEVHPRTVGKWVSTERAFGSSALASTKGTGRPRALSRERQTEVRKLVLGKNPLQLSFGTALWTVPLIQELIQKRFEVVLHTTTVMRMLRSLGLTPQKPQRRAFERDEKECRTWAQDMFPSIVRRARRKQATLLFEDEAGVHEDGPIARTWGRRGKRPIVKVSGKRRRHNLISAVSPRGRLWFRGYGGSLNAKLFIAFLEALLHDVRGYIVLVLDRHPAHRSAETQRWLHDHRDRIEIHFLPAYAPELNPDEHVWSYLKGLFRRTPVLGTEHFEDAVENVIAGIASDTALVRTFFQHPDVGYVKEALGW
jgi:transposase